MPLWPVPAVVTIAAICLALANQETTDLLLTGGVVALAGLYYACHLRSRRETHWIISKQS
ncbi:hypothetical protein ACFQ0O_29110 [Saccharopolyspora spinosporotrichia]